MPYAPMDTINWKALAEARNTLTDRDMTIAKLREWNDRKALRDAEAQYQMQELGSKSQLLPVQTQHDLMKAQYGIDEMPQSHLLQGLQNQAQTLQANDILTNFSKDKEFERSNAAETAAMAKETWELNRAKAMGELQDNGYPAQSGGIRNWSTLTPQQIAQLPPEQASKVLNLKKLYGAGADDKQTTRVQDANDSLNIINKAKPILKDATGSGTGAILDWVASKVFGSTTTGALNTSKLKVLSGLLVSKMPKMSGPQSDKDVLLYKEMAGQIGDPTVPQKEKAAALETLRSIQEKYAGVAEGSSIPLVNDKGWPLHVDENGNKAYVGPNNEIEEL